MLISKEEKTKAAQGRKNKKGSKKGDMEEVRAVNNPGLTLKYQIIFRSVMRYLHSVMTLGLRALFFPQMFVDLCSVTSVSKCCDACTDCWSLSSHPACLCVGVFFLISRIFWAQHLLWEHKLPIARAYDLFDCFQDDLQPVELIRKPKEYVVKFSFPLPPPLNPPILGLKCKSHIGKQPSRWKQTKGQLVVAWIRDPPSSHRSCYLCCCTMYISLRPRSHYDGGSWKRRLHSENLSSVFRAH